MYNINEGGDVGKDTSPTRNDVNECNSLGNVKNTLGYKRKYVNSEPSKCIVDDVVKYDICKNGDVGKRYVTNTKWRKWNYNDDSECAGRDAYMWDCDHKIMVEMT